MFRLLSTERGAIAELAGKAMALQHQGDKSQLSDSLDDIAAGTNAEIITKTNVLGDVMVSFPINEHGWGKLQKSNIWKQLCKFLEENQMDQKTSNHNKSNRMSRKQRDEILCYIAAAVTSAEEKMISSKMMYALTVLTLFNSLMMAIQTLLLLSM